MFEREVTVANRAGVHARPASKIVKLASRFSAEIFVECSGDRVNGKSIMGIIALGAGFRSTLCIEAEGEDEEAAVDALVALIEGKFEDG